MVRLNSCSLVHHKDSVGIDDRGQSVRNDKGGAVLEATLEFFLNEVVSFQIDIGSSLIEHKDLSLSDDGSSKAKELLLTHREEIVALGNQGHDTTLAVLFDVLHQSDLFKGLDDLIILKFFEGIKIFSYRTLNQERLLWDISNTLSQKMETNCLAVNAINDELTFMAFGESEENLENG